MVQDPKLTTLIAYHVAGARLGRARNAEALVRLCDARLMTHARYLTDDIDTARDVVQDAWIDILRGLNGLRDDRAFVAFALQIVTRKAARDVARRQRARQVVDDPFPPAPPADPDLPQAIAALPATDRAALGLFYTQGLSVAEIAQALSIPPGTVKTRLMRARTRLRALLTGEDHGQH